MGKQLLRTVKKAQTKVFFDKNETVHPVFL